jgi:Fic family protein
MKQLLPRHHLLLDLLAFHGRLSNVQAKAALEGQYGPLSRTTVVRDFEVLLSAGLVVKTGRGRSVGYALPKQSLLLRYFDPSLYFQSDLDQRSIVERFNFEVFDALNTTLFSGAELKHLKALTKAYQKRRKALTPREFQKEMERLTIELSWKSSQIEGNTYSLLDTEALIKENREAPGHTREETQMIRNHKRALDYIFAHPAGYKTLSVSKIEDIHRLLMTDLEIDHGLRKRLVRITGTRFKPLDNTHQIKDALQKTCTRVNRYADPFHQAFATILLISYIQPFIDGNKRTGRITGNALLHAHDACPLSYRSIDAVDYKEAILLFYEQNSVRYFKDLFLSQYQFSVENYFG